MMNRFNCKCTFFLAFVYAVSLHQVSEKIFSGKWLSPSADDDVRVSPKQLSSWLFTRLKNRAKSHQVDETIAPRVAHAKNISGFMKNGEKKWFFRVKNSNFGTKTKAMMAIICIRLSLSDSALHQQNYLNFHQAQLNFKLRINSSIACFILMCRMLAEKNRDWLTTTHGQHQFPLGLTHIIYYIHIKILCRSFRNVTQPTGIDATSSDLRTGVHVGPLPVFCCFLVWIHRNPGR